MLKVAKTSISITFSYCVLFSMQAQRHAIGIMHKEEHDADYTGCAIVCILLSQSSSSNAQLSRQFEKEY